MTAKPSRLRVLDLVGLIAATALGLALSRHLPDYLAVSRQISITQEFHVGGGSSGWLVSMPGSVFTPTGRPVHRRPSYWLTHVPYWVGPPLASWTLAAMALSLCGRGSVARRWARRPGMVAGLAVIIALAVEAAWCLQLMNGNGMLLTSLKWGAKSYWCFFWISVPRIAGFTVAVSWLVLAVGGRWKAGLGGLETLSRALGWGWIAMMLAVELGEACFDRNY